MFLVSCPFHISIFSKIVLHLISSDMKVCYNSQIIMLVIIMLTIFLLMVSETYYGYLYPSVST
jgi:hypothetical protein